MFFKATAVSGGANSKHAPFILNSAVIMGVWNQRVLVSRDLLEQIGMEIFSSAKEISHIAITPEEAQSLLDNK